jgi:hypothetical protein
LIVGGLHCASIAGLLGSDQLIAGGGDGGVHVRGRWSWGRIGDGLGRGRLRCRWDDPTPGIE